MSTFESRVKAATAAWLAYCEASQELLSGLGEAVRGVLRKEVVQRAGLSLETTPVELAELTRLVEQYEALRATPSGQWPVGLASGAQVKTVDGVLMVVAEAEAAGVYNVPMEDSETEVFVRKTWTPVREATSEEAAEAAPGVARIAAYYEAQFAWIRVEGQITKWVNAHTWTNEKLGAFLGVGSQFISQARRVTKVRAV